jgi:hypothetical protein
MEKKQISNILFFGETVLFKELLLSIMVTRNPNWSTEILWYGTGYAKRKILSPLKRLPQAGYIAGFILNCYEFVFIPFFMVPLQYCRLWCQ